MQQFDVITEPCPRNMKWFHRTISMMKLFRAYHRHRVLGLENVPSDGSAILVINHSMALYDIFLLWEAVYRNTGRYTRTLIDRFFYKIPLIESTLARPMGANVASWDTAKKLIRARQLLLLSPGGMREWRKPSSERYQIQWEGRTGYAKLAIETQTPIILAACPKADDLYEVYENPVSQYVYKKYRAPFVLFRGWGFSNLPRPIRLTHYLSEPIQPPSLSFGKKLEDQVEAFHGQVQKRMQELLMDGVKHRH